MPTLTVSILRTHCRHFSILPLRKCAWQWPYPERERRPWPVRSRRSASSSILVVFDFFLSDAEFGQHLLMRNRSVVFEPLAGFVEGVRLFRGQRLIVYRRVGDGARDGIQHHLEQAAHGGDLAG